jgi:cytoskeleton protein RodZ
MDIGSELRAARKARGLTVAQVAALTRIRHSYLEAIERNDFDVLPAPIYARGFLSAYAREVGLDPRDIVQRFTSTYQASKVTPPADRIPEPRDAQGVIAARLREVVARSIAARSGPEPEPAGSDTGSMSAALRGWPSILVIFLLLWAYLSFLAYRHANELPEQRAQTARSDKSEPANTRQAVATSGGGPAIPARPDGLRVELHATGPCWIGARADGAPVFNRLMETGDRQTIEARDEIVLRAGDPGTLELSINGVRSRPIGKPGQAVTVRINPKNYVEFVDPAPGSTVANPPASP